MRLPRFRPLIALLLTAAHTVHAKARSSIWAAVGTVWVTTCQCERSRSMAIKRGSGSALSASDVPSHGSMRAADSSNPKGLTAFTPGCCAMKAVTSLTTRSVSTFSRGST